MGPNPADTRKCLAGNAAETNKPLYCYSFVRRNHMGKTKSHRTSHPLAPMLAGSFATELENRFAELNNLLALQGVLTSDPLAIALSGIRRGAREIGVTFERVVPTAAPVVTAPVAKPATTKAATAPVSKPAKGGKAASTEAAPAPKARKARVIKEDQIATLQVAGSVSEAAPYGTDADGRPLAPYGIKNDGVPMKRRGRTASAPVAKAPAARSEVAETAAPAVEEAAPASGETEVPAAAASDDLDDLLSGLDA